MWLNGFACCQLRIAQVFAASATAADQEYDGIIQRGARLRYTYGEATVAKITKDLLRVEDLAADAM